MKKMRATELEYIPLDLLDSDGERTQALLRLLKAYEATSLGADDLFEICALVEAVRA